MGSPPYIELHCRSAFSLLDGASLPEELATVATHLGMTSLALTDLDDLGGAVRFVEACAESGIRPILGAEVTYANGGSLVLLCEDERGWANLCTAITRARAAHARGEPSLDLDALAAHAAGLVCLSGGRGGALDREWAVAEGLEKSTTKRKNAGPSPLAGALSEVFGGRFYLEVQDHALAEDVARISSRIGLARELGLPWVVTNDVRHATARGKPIHDALVCLKRQVTLDEAGDLLFPNDTRRLIAPADVARTWRGEPAGVLRTLEVAERCAFRLKDIRPTLPRYPVDDAGAFLEARVREGMRSRYPQPTDAHERQIRHELEVIRRLGLAGYFLIVWDVVRFARERNILVQGRGSAANSAVCYCLGITAVDPIGLELLFERFLTEDRTEAPDIDIDISHRDREDVLQYVYERYDREHAAMVCEQICWRGRSAVRDAARVLGLPAEVGDKLAGQVGHGVPTDAYAEDAVTAAEALARGGIAAAGLDPRDGRMRALLRVVHGLDGLPRHRGIHVGGFVLTGGALSSVVPIEPASMAGRTVIQWEKDDLDPIGLVKIDLLGLGILTLLSDAIALAKRHRGMEIDLGRLPPDDPEVYARIHRADTVGVFQVESRAQMSVLPRTRPTRFYDLVVQVALIRPGPIQGDMVHPYLRRRSGLEPVTYLHPVLEPVLARTLGVPLFQEQSMKVAVVAAGFSPSQADDLRRAMSSKRSHGKMARLSLELLQGMERRGIPRETAEKIVKQLTAFASYGFPESHAASFALLVYASAWMKTHHAPEFFCAILNAQPMGFYPIGTLIADARRNGVKIRRADVTRSAWDSTLEDLELRLGIRLVRGLGPKAQEAFERARRAPGALASIESFARATEMPVASLVALARAGALDTLAGDRRRALWEVLRVGRTPAGPLDVRGEDRIETPLAAVTDAEATMEDYALVGGSPELHPMQHLRERLRRAKIPTIAELATLPPGPIRIAGLVNSRQRPMTAKGFVFLSLEDETGMCNIIVSPRLFDREHAVIARAPVLLVIGELEKRHGTINVKAHTCRPIRDVPGAGGAKSHDFH